MVEITSYFGEKWKPPGLSAFDDQVYVRTTSDKGHVLDVQITILDGKLSIAVFPVWVVDEPLGYLEVDWNKSLVEIL